MKEQQCNQRNKYVEIMTLMQAQDIRSKGLPSGPVIATSKYRRLSSCGTALIPGAGSAINRSVSYMMSFTDLHIIYRYPVDAPENK